MSLSRYPRDDEAKPAPHQGDDTEAILHELGYSPQRVAELRASFVVVDDNYLGRRRWVTCAPRLARMRTTESFLRTRFSHQSAADFELLGDNTPRGASALPFPN
jgi:hypothetical protein